ncbi:histidine phosphatase family protein [Halotalea alkalilenta]|uniref:histidine phosphatase family protein n=1 Tax=Halotalea alkalilenta TaxID=376489 RepID=UPI000694B764|nr:histidine phosphatase family protein [Halotalea alkalilenta]
MHSREMVIDCLRHGACEGASSLRGRTDVALSPQGRVEFERAALRLRPPDRLVSSPLERCRESAERLSQRWALPLEIDQELEEIDFGAWDGVPLERLAREHPKELAAFWADPEASPPPGGEPVSAFRSRIERAWQRLVSPPCERVMVITHAGVIKGWLVAHLGLPGLDAARLATLGLDYAGLVRFRVGVDHACPHRQWVRLEHFGAPQGVEEGP